MTPLAVTVDEEALAEIVRSAVVAEIDARDLTGDLAVSVQRAAVLLDCSAHTIRRLVGGGVLPTVPEMGNRVLIPMVALKAHAMAGASPGHALREAS